MNVLEKLGEIGAVFANRHFVYASGKHGSGYINMDLMFPNVTLVSRLCQDLVAPFAGTFDAIAAPATGGIELGVLAALSANTPGVWADKNGDGGFIFERAGFVEAIKGKRILIVEDLLTTGGSVEKVAREVERVGGTVVGVSVVCNRGNVTAEALGVPKLETLASVNFSAEDAEVCSLCATHVPIIEDMGHGDAYKEEHPDYVGGYEKLQEEV